MKLDCVLASVNEDPFYLDFIPFFIKVWSKLYPKVDVKIILIAKQIPEKFIEFKNNIILFNPIENISSVFISKYIRLLYPPLLNYDNGILITNIDNVPLSRDFFTKNIEDLDDKYWVNYRSWKELDHTGEKLSLCWQISNRNNWAEVFGINSLNDIKQRLIEKSQNMQDCKEELDLCKYLMNWHKKTNRYINLNDNKTGFRRLERSFRKILSVLQPQNHKHIKEGFFSDYNCMRPMEDYAKLNDFIYSIL